MENRLTQQILTSQSVRDLRASLKQFCESAEARYVAVLEESGLLWCDFGDEAFRDSGETAALANGAYMAIKQVAARLGEEKFEGLFHEGQRTHFYLSPLGQTFLLLTVFGKETPLGIVRAALSRHSENLASLTKPAQTLPPLAGEDQEGDFDLDLALQA